ncbi:MAG TPA: thymidine phosphorylase [Kiritimatiellia bacterium]|nr:thymidine phosphorylase [Kiritimatiellia bacterium]HRZ13614.1 thymidine phosphorylase [Kiritimatiellia bacterium]HSA19290.1 thymidine phosphorylase [Kiritimatiellia bacterium]
MLPQWIIEKKRDGQALSEEEIRCFIEGYTVGRIPDYQMAAMAMAIYCRGMTAAETAVITDAMMRSGDLVDTSSIKRPKVDKHSTGGIGDKVSLILAPLVACCGVAVPMISGRGLGITGGTLDKMESIPGYRTDLSVKEFVRVIQRCGCSIIGQTGRLAPADKKLYALRDVTGTVPSIPLITASIMSKKLAEGIDALVLDVKWGKGAFMRTIEDARALARSMVNVGTHMGKGMAALITDMNRPLGRCAGNALEVIESVQTLKNEGPADLVEVTLALSARMLLLAKKAKNEKDARAQLKKHLASGKAYEVFQEMVRLQGGDAGSLEKLHQIHAASLQEPMPATAAGTIAAVDAERVGKACVILGAGRTKTDDKVDFAVGVSGLMQVGEKVTKGQPLVVIHANDENRLEEARKLLDGAFTIRKGAVKEPPLVYETILK